MALPVAKKTQAPVVQDQAAIGFFTRDDLIILRNTKFRGFDEVEIQYASKICAQLNLSPFLNQIHFVRRKNNDGTYSITTQVGIDGFRLHAQRSGGYAGSDEPVFEYDDKSDGTKYPCKATVTVYKIVQGVRCPFTASARWDEFFPGEGPHSFMWNKMPHNQLAKCAEALAHRKASPAELSGLYVEDEMHKERSAGGVRPEQPTIGDGVQTQSYCVPYGPLAKQPIEDCDPQALKEYVEAVEAKSKKSGRPLGAWALELIRHAEPLIADYERQIANQMRDGA